MDGIKKVCTQNQKKCAHKKEARRSARQQECSRTRCTKGKSERHEARPLLPISSRGYPGAFLSLDSADPLDLLWDQIKLAYAAIMRAQHIMHVQDQNDKTIEKVGDSKGKIISEKWEVQQAWDKQASFLQAQAKAQKELTGMIKQYEELLHKNWDLATEEQRARITALKDKVKTDEDRAVNITFVKASEQNGKEH